MAVVPVASGSEFLGASYIYPTGSCHEGQQHHVSHIQYSAENTLTRKFTLIQVYKFIGQITMIVYSQALFSAFTREGHFHVQYWAI